MHLSNSFLRPAWAHVLVFALALIFSARCAAAAEIIFVSDFENSHAIQWVRHHSVVYNGISIALGPAYVTATMVSGGGNNLTTYLQVPPALNGNPDYPDWSALKTFGSSAGAPAIGDCVRAEGTITEFKGATELSTTTLTTLTDQDCGGVAVSPYANESVTSLATDSDLLTNGYQPGPRDEALESVLVRLYSLMAISGNDASGDFRVSDQFSPNAAVVVGNNLYTRSTLAMTLFISITGVLDQQDTVTDTVYQLLPRGAGDFNP